MVSLPSPVCDFGLPAPDFDLPGVDGKRHTLAGSRGPNGLLVMFICNHCPYVKAIIHRLIRDVKDLKALGVGSIAIMSNDVLTYTEDSWEHMVEWSRELDFDFPYVIDETQQIARDYGAICTPDFFGYNANLELNYRGRLDASRVQPAPDDARRDLFLAMKQIALYGDGPTEQIASVGCSIKWRNSI